MKCTVSSIVLLFLLINVYGSTPDTTTVSLIRKKYTSGSTIIADFELKTWWNVREREDQKKGALIVASGEKFRVTLGNDQFISDGEVYYHYSSASKQAQIKKLQNTDLSMHPSQILTSFLTQYPLKETVRSGTQVTLSWRADSLAKSVAQETYIAVEVVADIKGVIKMLRCTDANGNVFTYTFTKTEFGITLPKGVFKFDIPKDAQVIDER